MEEGIGDPEHVEAGAERDHVDDERSERQPCDRECDDDQWRVPPKALFNLIPRANRDGVR